MRPSYAPPAAGPFASATLPLREMGRTLRDSVIAEGAHAWLRRLASMLLRSYYARPRAERVGAAEDLPEDAASQAIVRRACLRTAAMGGATGLFTTVTSVTAAQTSGLGALMTIPVAALAVSADALARFGVHLTMVAAIADLFELRFEPDEPADLWALLALSFGPDAVHVSPPRAGEQIVHIARLKAEEVANDLGKWILGESLVRNAVPFLNVLSSSATSWFVTRRLGDNARRYARYRRAFEDVLAEEPRLAAHLDLVIEGVWFLFTADGHLEPEESALLASLMRRCDAPRCDAIVPELADDIAWVERLGTLPEPLRDPFLRLLEVAAAVDKRATPRERSLLRHAARALGRREDLGELERMLHDFREVGVLSR